MLCGGAKTKNRRDIGESKSRLRLLDLDWSLLGMAPRKNDSVSKKKGEKDSLWVSRAAVKLYHPIADPVNVPQSIKKPDCESPQRSQLYQTRAALRSGCT